MPEETPEPPPSQRVQLTEKEMEDAEERSGIQVRVVHEAIRLEGEQELRRSSSALAWSGLAAGLCMGFSLVGEGVLRSLLPNAPWRPLISKLGYSFGFVMVILGRQQLFTENTLTPILPLLDRRDLKTLVQVLRLWFWVLVTNLLGALIFAWVCSNTGAFRPETQKAFAEIGRESISTPFGLAILRGVFAGWLIATMVWLLPYAEMGRLFVIVGLTWLVGVTGLTHVIAGAVEVLFLVTAGLAPWQHAVYGYIFPTLIGNILGGISLVAALNHAQVVAK
jgi:formate/nitrite transporter FocA (FNT family)